MATNYTSSFNINVDDLQYMLKQIKIAEATSIGYTAAPKTTLDSIIAAYGGDAISAALLPAGLRTVDGTFNNLLIAPTGTFGTPGYNPGTSQFGAADTLFPRLTNPIFQNVNGPGIDFNGDGIIDVINHNYGDASAAPGTQIRSVADTDPRTISNLIVDMSINNPAAIAAYLGNPISLEQFAADHPGMNPVAPGGIINVGIDLEVTNIDLATIPNQSPDIGLSPGFNSWMTFFGQFFDHGLDLVTKGANGTIYIPLTADDPLYNKGADGIANNVVDAYFVTDPALTPVGGPLPAVSGVATAWQAFYETDPANRALFAPGAFAPVITATPTAFAVKFNDDGFGADGLVGTADDKPNFMALTRATATIDANGIPQTQNTTTPWIDQNQTYTSNASHQVFLREYTKIDLGDANGLHTVATGRLIDGTAASGSAAGAIGNWGEVKAQAIEMLGLKLSDHDVNNVPLLLTDQYGKFIPGANGFARVTVQVQIVNDATGAVVGAQGSPFFMDGVAGGLDLANLAVPGGLPVLAAGQHYQTVTVGTNHAFLNDIAHHAAPGFVDLNHDGFKETKQTADTDVDTNHNGKFDFVDGIGGRAGQYDIGIDTTTDILTDVNHDGEITTADFFADDGDGLTYDNEMLESHFITGDGRGNENIALSSVHSIFHSEHNRAVEVNKATILAAAADASLNSADHTLSVAFLNEWLLTDVAADATVADIAALTPASLVWDGERLFQAGRFSTEMQYQHLVFEEFARRIQPAVDPFIFTNSAALNPSIVAEFKHTVYRFGHSMLTGTVDRLDINLNPLNPTDPLSVDGQQTLLAVFLNPQAYTASGADAANINANLIRGLSRDVGNALDEFIVTDVRSTLLGLPLDLAALNIARGRETGIPSLNETRTQLYASSGVADVKPYANWAEFAAAITNPMSIVNFIAAYGTHASILAATNMAGMRDAASKLVFGDSTLTGQAAIDFDNDRFDFLSATGAYADSATNHHLGGMNDIDLWIGGLAEAHPEFGGMLGTTFNYVFEYQLESLQNGDRFYYLSRTQGLNFVNQLEPNTFADLVMRNTELGDIYSTHLNGFLFVTPDHFLELDRGIAQEDYDLTQATSGLNLHNDPLWAVGEAHSLLTPLKVMRNYNGATTTVDSETGITHDVGGTLRFTGGEHVVVGGTEGNDKIWTDRGIDTLWGDGGDDYLNAGTESDNVFGGAGDDIIEDPFGDDLLRGNQGNDVITSARGADIFFGDQGQDYIVLGQDASEVFAGQDNDFILGGLGTDGLMGNEGDDWIEGGEGLDGISGENSQLFFNSTIIGHDVLNGQGNDTDYDGESGDDIMFQTAGITRSNGMFGFDWGIHKNDSTAANSDLGIPIFATQLPFTLRDRFDSVEGLSGWIKDDILTGATLLKGGAAGFGAGPGNPVDESDLKAKNVHLIDGLANLLGLSPAQLAALLAQELAEEAVAPTSLTAARSSSVFSIVGGGEIILGGGGNDTIKGNLGDDILDGDAWLNVRIKIVHAGITYSAESMNTSTLISGPNAGKVFNTFADGTPDFNSPAFGGASLTSLMLNRTLNPGDLSIVREILQATTAATDVDTAVYNGSSTDYTITENADGTYTITDNRAAGILGNDGSDKVRNIEKALFLGDGVTISLTAGPVNFAPVITSSGAGLLAAIAIAENTVAVAQVTATDANNVIGDPLNPQGITFTIIGGADQAQFTINPITGQLSFVSAPNFENPTQLGLIPNVYEVIVVASDGIAIDTQTISVTVTDVFEPINLPPTITSNGGGATAATSTAENSTAVTTITAIDPEGGAITYAITGGADSAKFAINATSGVLAFVAAPNFEAPTDAGADNVYDVIVSASDGVFTDTQALAATVTNVNEAPVITSDGAGATATFTIAENTTAVTTVAATDVDAGTTLTYTLSGVDAAKFAINAAGALSFVTGPNFESATDVGANNVYNVTVTVSDGALTDTQDLAVTVSNVNEAATGLLRISGYSFNTNLVGNTTSANLIASNTIVDPDGMTSVVQYQWQRLVAGNWVDIAGATSSTINNLVNDSVRVRSSYTDPFGVNNFVSAETGFITGNNAANTSVGSAGNDIILGLGGADILTGNAGNDTIDGGSGIDRIVATVNDGNDAYFGGAGVDTYDLTNTTTDATVNLTLGTSSSAETGVDTLSGIENVLGGNGNNTMTDGAGVNRLDGGAGNDKFNMTLDNVRDDIRGGVGSDTVDYSAFTNNLTIALNGAGNSIVFGSGNAGATSDVIRNIENFIGGSGNDTITGDNQANQLNGGSGNDTITGGTGADVLTGGLGADVFVYGNTNQSGIGVAARDLITDFLSGTDRLNFAAIDANTTVGGNQAFVFNNVAGAAFTAAGQLVYHYEGSGASEVTVIQGNVNNNLNPDFEVALLGHITLNQATDIVL